MSAKAYKRRNVCFIAEDQPVMEGKNEQKNGERTRLYRMAVGLILEELSGKFEIYAEVNNSEEFLPFQKNMQIR